MDAYKQKCFRLIKNFNRDWNLDLEIKDIIFWNRINEAQYEGWGTHGSIRLNPNDGFELVTQHLYHELGHAVIDQYKVKRKDLELFVANSETKSRGSVQKLMDHDVEPPWNYVSWYATVNGTEDFCETLSAWAYNQYKSSGLIQFDGWISSLNKEKFLNKKVQRIDKILTTL
jgi:hypothetical protein